MALIRGVRLALRAASSEAPVFHGTTILCVRKAGETVMIGDGQVTLGSQVIKGNARKLRRLREGRIVAGFAGATADAMTLMERLEEKLDEHSGQLLRSCVDLAAAWRTDKYLRRLEAMMLVADQKHMLTLTGSGDVLEPQNSVMAIGSGGGFAYAAALALTKNGDLPAEEIAKKAMEIAAEMCVYTNDSFIVEKISSDSSE